MAKCEKCGKRGFFLVLKDGLCDDCAQKLSESENQAPKRRAPDPYVLNPKTMVIHRRGCKYAEGTYTFDRRSTTSKSAALAVGYKPCKFCKP